MNNEWLKLKQAALFLNIPEITLRRWVKTGRIKHIMTAGRQYRFHIDDLKAFQSRYPMYSKPKIDPVDLQGMTEFTDKPF